MRLGELNKIQSNTFWSPIALYFNVIGLRGYLAQCSYETIHFPGRFVRTPFPLGLPRWPGVSSTRYKSSWSLERKGGLITHRLTPHLTSSRDSFEPRNTVSALILTGMTLDYSSHPSDIAKAGVCRRSLPVMIQDTDRKRNWTFLLRSRTCVMPFQTIVGNLYIVGQHGTHFVILPWRPSR